MEGYPDLFPDTEDSRLIKIEKNGDIIHYSRTKAPWPVSDRDGTYRSHFSSEGNTSTVRLETVSGLVDEKEGVVRILDSEAIWTLKELGNKQIELVYEVYANPNGSIPAWLVNSAAISLPFETLVNMKDLVLERSEQAAFKKILSGICT